VAQLASDEEGTFGKAYLKYCDAASFASDNYLYHLHIGRFLSLQGKHDEAVKRLQIAVGLKPVNVESRYILQFDTDLPENTVYRHSSPQRLLF
jgi:tetratricopeptide (TPR) repeat protein